jgi:hypothetical protein
MESYKTYKVIENEIEYIIYEYDNENEYWFLNNQLHRENGPAIIHSDGSKEYWLNDIHYPDVESDKEWIRLVPIIDIIK